MTLWCRFLGTTHQNRIRLLLIKLLLIVCAQFVFNIQCYIQVHKQFNVWSLVLITLVLCEKQQTHFTLLFCCSSTFRENISELIQHTNKKAANEWIYGVRHLQSSHQIDNPQIVHFRFIAEFSLILQIFPFWILVPEIEFEPLSPPPPLPDDDEDDEDDDDEPKTPSSDSSMYYSFDGTFELEL